MSELSSFAQLTERVDIKRPTVLIVDDVRDDLETLGTILENAGMEVLAAPTGEAALHFVGQLDVDLVMVAMSSPVVNGHAVCPKLLELSRGSVPVIFVSSKEDGDTLAQAATASVDYVSKPIQRREVLARVGKQLELARLARELARQNGELREIQAELAEQIERRRDAEAKLASAGAGHTDRPEALTLNLNAVKDQLITQALAQTQGNVTAAARILGVHRSWFYRRRAVVEER